LITDGASSANANGGVCVNRGTGAGKPSYSREQYDAVRDLLSRDAGISVIAKSTRLTRQTIYRIKEEPMMAEAALAIRGM